jgi:acyl-CoA thioester hydrolase
MNLDLPPPDRTAYRAFETLDTRWQDEDVYGHVNNVSYYAFFDTAVNRRLIASGALDPRSSAVFGVVAETRCRYLAPVGFPDRIEVGLRLERLGTTSVTYGLAVFRAGEAQAAAVGLFTHVYVDRDTRRPVPIPDAPRRAIEALAVI